MSTGPHFWSEPSSLAPGVYELSGIDQLTTLVALVAPGVRVAAVRTGPLNKPVCKELVALGAVQLVHAVLEGVARFVQGPEYILGNFGLLLSCGATKLVKADVEPLVYLRVELIVLVAYLLGAETLLYCLGFCLGAVLIGAAHIEHVITPEPGKPRVNISGEDTANNVSQVRDIVNIWQGGSYQDVSFPVLR